MLTNLLRQTIKVKRPTYTQGANLGIQIGGVSTVYSNVPASVQGASETIMEYYASQHIVVSHQIYVAQKLTLLMGDIINDGTTDYTFEGLRDPSGTGRVWTIDVKVYG